jgi:hypothetical protein
MGLHMFFQPWQHIEFVSLFYAYHKIDPPNAHIPHTRSSILVWSEPCIQERGNIYIYQYTKNNYQFTSHKSCQLQKIHHMDNTNMVKIMIGSLCDSN